MSLTNKSVISICDTTLRDGNHAVGHQLTARDIALYARAAEKARVDVLEVGHGNGLGGSSIQVGRALVSDIEMVRVAKAELTHTRVGVLSVPGFAAVERDLRPVLDLGVDEVRVGAHCTEADITRQQISLLSSRGVTVKGVLLMTHMVSATVLLEQAKMMQDYGATAVVLMDSAGAYRPDDVREKISTLTERLSIAVGFHAHNNLGLAVINSLIAADEGATILDATARGFGAGAGNAPLELLAANLTDRKMLCRLDVSAVMDAVEMAGQFISAAPSNDRVTITSGLAGVFSGFAKHVRRASEQFDVDSRDVLFELGRRGVVAGQEDMVVEVALALSTTRDKISRVEGA